MPLKTSCDFIFTVICLFVSSVFEPFLHCLRIFCPEYVSIHRHISAPPLQLSGTGGGSLHTVKTSFSGGFCWLCWCNRHSPGTKHVDPEKAGSMSVITESSLHLQPRLKNFFLAVRGVLEVSNAISKAITFLACPATTDQTETFSSFINKVWFTILWSRSVLFLLFRDCCYGNVTPKAYCWPQWPYVVAQPQWRRK